MPETLSHCARELRHGDRDRFLCALFAPADRREDLFAVYAFALEVARVPELVREPVMGQIRLQWWREALGVDAPPDPQRRAEAARSPVAAAICGAVERHRLPRPVIGELLEARESDLEPSGLEPSGPRTLADLERYAEATGGAVAELAVRVLGAGGAAIEAARHVGTAWALSGLVRAAPFHAAQGRRYLPAEDAATVRDVADTAARRLAAARGLRAGVERRALPALLPGVLADADLRRLARCGFDPRHPKVAAAGGAGRPLRLAVSAARGRY